MTPPDRTPEGTVTVPTPTPEAIALVRKIRPRGMQYPMIEPQDFDAAAMIDQFAQRARAEALEEVYRHITALMSECLPHYPEYRALFEARSIVHALIQPAPESK